MHIFLLVLLSIYIVLVHVAEVRCRDVCLLFLIMELGGASPLHRINTQKDKCIYSG